MALWKKDSTPNHALAVDIWSLGCTIIEMLNGKPPWSDFEGVVDIKLIATQLNEQVRSGRVKKGSIIQLIDYICNTVQNRRFAEAIDLNVQYPVAHKHIPYVVIIVKMVDEWKTGYGGTLPSIGEEKREFKELLKSRMTAMDEENYKEAIDASFKVFAPQGTMKTG